VILVTSFSNTCISVLVLVPHTNRAGNPVPGSVLFSKFFSFLVPVPVSKIRPSSDSILTYRNQYQFISDLTKQVLAQHQLLPLSTSTRGVSHCGLVIYIKKYLKKKKNYGNSNISPCKNIMLKKPSKKKPNPSKYHNSITNLKFQCKPKYHVTKILM
jgi:hypothetical protein